MGMIKQQEQDREKFVTSEKLWEARKNKKPGQAVSNIKTIKIQIAQSKGRIKHRAKSIAVKKK
mgnify:CR=1 FL=1